MDTGLIRLGLWADNHHAGFALYAVDLLLPCRVGKGADASDFPGDLCAHGSGISVLGWLRAATEKAKDE